MTLDIHNWSSSIHQEIHKIVKDEIFPIVNQVDAKVQNFEIQFLKKAAKFVRDFKSLAKEADESLAKHKALELEIERLLRAVVSQDIMSIVQNPSVENEYPKLWNDWYKKCEECKYDKISYDKAYNDMQQKIEQLQAQLGDQKGKSKDTPCVSNTLDPLSQKLENENVELEFQVQNYEKENAHLKTTYKNLFDSISVTRAQTKTIIDSLQNKLHDTIYENAKLRAQLFDKVSEQEDTTKGTSTNTKFANQSTLGKPSLRPFRNHSVVRQPNEFQSERPKRVPPKVVESNDLSKPVTSNSVPTTKESKVVENDKVIAPGMFRIDPCTTSRVDKFVPINKVRASARTNPIIASQPHVITKKIVNSDSNGFSSIGVDITTKTRRPQPRSNTKNDRVPSAPQISYIKNKEVDVEEHHRNLLLSKNKKHMSSECNNIRLAIQNDKSEIVCAMCKQCLITTNHDVCVLNYVNGMNSRGTVRFGNYHVAAILGFGDLQWGNILITRVYFVEGLGHNLFSVGLSLTNMLILLLILKACQLREFAEVFVFNLELSDSIYSLIELLNGLRLPLPRLTAVVTSLINKNSQVTFFLNQEACLLMAQARISIFMVKTLVSLDVLAISTMILRRTLINSL
ncbi:hypothetical protein Tco_0968050 [Tanacetum coccineum]